MKEVKHLLVTGGVGFIGSNFVQWLCRQHLSVEITILDSVTYTANRASLQQLDSRAYTLVEGDICDSQLVDSLVKKADAILHLAAESHNDNAIAHPLPFVQTNVFGTFVLLEAARKYGTRFHHVSTDEVFGDLALESDEQFVETSPYRPNSPYAASKASADHLVRAWYKTYGVPITISNCSNNYGPRQHVEKFIPRQITNILTARAPELYGDGSHVRDWMHVDDHSQALWTILTQGTIGETYLISAHEERSNLEVLRIINTLMGRDSDDFEMVPDRAGHDRRYASNASKLEAELGWRPKHNDFRAGIAETIAWYEQNRAWWRAQKEVCEEKYAAQRGNTACKC